MNEAQQAAIKRIKALCLDLRLALEELEEGPIPPPPDNVRSIRPDEVELEGVIGRPMVKEVKGKTLFTAGLGAKEGDVTQWYNLEMWGSFAVAASTIQRGQVVRVVGIPKDVQYVNDQGILCTKRQLIASVICPVEHVGSAKSQSDLARA